MSSSRFTKILNLAQYRKVNKPLKVGKVEATPPNLEQRVLRILVSSPYSRGLKVPAEYSWTLPIIAQAQKYQMEKIGIRHPYVYLTIRSGIVSTRTDLDWHVDGFSVKYNHLPEANYIVMYGPEPTEYVEQCFDFPFDFNPLRHNIQTFFQHRVDPASIRTIKPGTLYFLDPYVVHRRPPSASGKQRTFVRISFTPIEIPDCNNTTNPLIPTSHYSIDGVKEFRNTLLDYDADNYVFDLSASAKV
jgi:hypothetical protein